MQKKLLLKINSLNYCLLILNIIYKNLLLKLKYMKISANKIRVGNVLEYKGKLWLVLKTEHTKPGKGGAFQQVEMKEVTEGTKLNEIFRATETVEKASIFEKTYTFLYMEGDKLALMDSETFEQIEVSKDLVGEQEAFLQDGMEVTAKLHNENPIAIMLPQQVTLEITESDPVIKGQTVASSYKPAVLENGIRIMVPPFVETGDKVVVNTETREYVERAK